MISVPGTITIRSIRGRFGDFNKGTLDCTIGTFTVKDSSIEEFEPGVYNGNFVIDKIKPSSYFAAGTMVMEIRAFLNAIMLTDDGEPLPPAAPEGLEQDPIEEELTDGQLPANLMQTPMSNSVDDAAALFGLLWPLGNIVKLDPTINNRSVFRQQKDYLKSSGYRFEIANQHWMK